MMPYFPRPHTATQPRIPIELWAEETLQFCKASFLTHGQLMPTVFFRSTHKCSDDEIVTGYIDVAMFFSDESGVLKDGLAAIMPPFFASVSVDAMILATEAWSVRMEGMDFEAAERKRAEMPASLKDAPGRQEELMVLFETRTTRRKHMFLIERDGAKVTLGADSLAEIKDGNISGRMTGWLYGRDPEEVLRNASEKLAAIYQDNQKC